MIEDNAKIKVSIVIPTYNGENFIKETIESCFNQTYKNIEIIVIDDASTDSTKDIVESSFLNFDKFLLLSNHKNAGISASCNKGLFLAVGDYVIFLGHDDLLPPDHVEKILTEFDESVVFVHCNAMVIDAAGNFLRFARNDDLQKKKNEDAMFELSIENFIQSCGLMIRKEPLVRINGFDERYRNFGEWNNYIRLLDHGNPKYSTVSAGFYRRHQTNITNNFKNKKNMLSLLYYHDQCRVQALKKCRFSLNKYLKFSVSFIFSNSYVLAKRILG